MFVYVKADSIYPELMEVSRDVRVGKSKVNSTHLNPPPAPPRPPAITVALKSVFANESQ